MRRWRIFIALCVSVVLICIAGAQAYAQTRASDYFKGYSVYAYQGSNRGEMSIECEVRAESAVSKIGVLEIKIYRSDGIHVATIQGTTSNGLLSPESSFAHIVTYTYKGVPGTTYYAKVTLCAGTNSDYDVRNVQTQKVTAPY